MNKLHQILTPTLQPVQHRVDLLGIPINKIILNQRTFIKSNDFLLRFEINYSIQNNI